MIEPTGWIQGITSQFFYFVCYVCLITNHWDKKWSDTSFCAACFGCLWQCYRNTYASGLLLGWLFLVLFLFSLIELSLRHWFITKRNYLVSIFCLLGKGNNRQWSPGLYTPTEQQAKNRWVVQARGNGEATPLGSEPLISCVWPESRAFRAGRMRTF